MCHFVTAVLHSAEDTPPFRDVVAKHAMSFEPLENADILGQLSASEQYYRATGFMCDCGTGLGSVRDAKERSPSVEKQTAKLRKKRWGEAKIQKWLDQQESNRQDADRKNAGHAETLNAEAWLAFLEAALELKSVSEVKILLHWYSGMLTDEPFGKLRQEDVPFPSLSVELLRSVEEDVLYSFRSSAV